MTEKRSSYKLYELTPKIEDLQEMIEKLEGAEINEEVHEFYLELLAELDKTKNDFSEKVDSILSLIQYYKRWLVMRKEERNRLNKLIKKDEKTIEELSTYLKKHLEMLEIKELRTKKFNLSVNKSSQAPLMLNFEDKNRYPEKYLRTNVEVNKKLLKEDILSGDEEAIKYGHLGIKSTYLSIK